MSHIRWYEMRYEVAKFVLPLIKQYQIQRAGYPDKLYEEMGGSCVLAEARWASILKGIEEAMQSLVDDDDLEMTEEEKNTRQRNLELFGKWFTHLWD